FLRHRIEVRGRAVDDAGGGVDLRVAVEAADGGIAAVLERLAGAYPAPDVAGIDGALLHGVTGDEVAVLVGVVVLDHRTVDGDRRAGRVEPLVQPGVVGGAQQPVGILA